MYRRLPEIKLLASTSKLCHAEAIEESKNLRNRFDIELLFPPGDVLSEFWIQVKKFMHRQGSYLMPEAIERSTNLQNRFDVESLFPLEKLEIQLLSKSIGLNHHERVSTALD